MSSSGRIDELRRKFDENPRRYFAPLANEYRKVGDLDQAIFICQEYLPQQPGHMSGHIVYGQALFEARRPDDARAVFETALTLDPENLIALRHLGDIAREGGDLAAARGWYQRVLEADPRNEEIAGILNGLLTAPAHHETPASPSRPAPSEPTSFPDDRSAEGNAPLDDDTPDVDLPADGGFELGGSSVDLTSELESEAEFTPSSVVSSDATVAAESDTFATPDDPPFEEFSFASGFGAPTSGQASGAPESSGDVTDPPEEHFVPEEGPFVTELPGSALDPEPISTPDDTPAEGGFQLEGLEPTHHDASPPEFDAGASSPEPVTAAAADDLLDLDGAFEIPGTAAPKPAVAGSEPDTDPFGELVEAGAGDPAPSTPGEGWAEAAAADYAPVDAFTTEYAPQDAATTKFAEPDSVRAETPAREEVPVAPDGMFATETMADLYLAQGHREDAARIFERLLAERPDDAHLQARLDELRRPPTPPGPTVREYLQQLFSGGTVTGNGSDADADIVEPYDAGETSSFVEPFESVRPPAPASGGGSLDRLFDGVEPSAAAQAAALVLADAFAGESAGATDASTEPLRGRPALRASAELSLDAVFRDEPPRPASGFSFDQFFAEGGAASPANETSDTAAPPADDVAQFNDWLDGLKKS